MKWVLGYLHDLNRMLLTGVIQFVKKTNIHKNNAFEIETSFLWFQTVAFISTPLTRRRTDLLIVIMRAFDCKWLHIAE